MSRIRTSRFPLSLFLVLVAGAAASGVERTVSVSGSGLVSVPPDQVVVELRLTAVDDDLVRVRTSSDTQVKTILDLAQKHGSKEGEYEVSSLQLGLSFNEQLKRQVYNVERHMSVKLGVLANLNALIADLLKLPDLTVESITFGSSKSREHELEARRRAMTDAKATAMHLAELAGLKLGKAQQIATSDVTERPFVTSVVPVVGKNGGFFGRLPFRLPDEQRAGNVRVATADVIDRDAGIVFVAAQARAKQAAADPPADGAFGLGLIEFTASVSIDFELVE